MPKSLKSVKVPLKKTKLTEKNKNDFVHIYGCWAGLGWGTACCIRKNLQIMYFISEDTNNKTVIDKKLYQKFKKFI